MFYYIAVLVCIQIHDISASKLNDSAVSRTNLSILICKSNVRIKQSVISVAFKTILEKRLGICRLFIKLHHCIKPVTILVSH